jgi:hypothetical protein
MDMLELPKYIRGVEFFSLSAALTEFRRCLERESGIPIQDMELNAALILNDLCLFLHLGEKQRQQVLGQSAAKFIEMMLDARVDLKQNVH